VLGPLREKGELATAWSDPTKPSEIVGLGPFRVKELRAGERVVLERNPHYWKRDESGEPLPYLDEVVLEIFPSQEAAVLRFRAGELHVLERLEPRAFTELERNGGAQSPSPYRVMDLGAGLDHSFLFFNLNDSESDDPLAVEKTWFRDAEFRRAVSAAVDRDSIARLVYLGKASPLDTHVSPGNRHWYDPNASAPRYSLDDARERLAAASFRWDAEGRLLDAGGRRVELSILTSSSNEARKRIASIIVEDLRKLGIEATVVELEFRAYVSRIFENRDYDVVIAALGGGDTDPNPSTSILLSSGSMHMWRLGAREVAPWQAEIDRLMTEQLTVSDRARRRELYFRVQRLIAEHLPFIGVVSPHTLVGVARNLGNFRPGILRPHGLWNAEELYFVE
jgi:peptide/nickel transport system substrate-binding protein